MARNLLKIAKMKAENQIDAAWCSYAPGKDAWKSQGNFYTSEELRQIDNADDMTVYQPLDFVLSAD